MPEPIFDLNTVRSISSELLKAGNYRAFLLFQLGTGTPYELNTLMSLKVKDLVQRNIQFYLEKNIPDKIEKWLKTLNDQESLFGESDYQEIEQTARDCGLEDFDRETMRKTFGYNYFHKTKDIRQVERALDMKPETVTFKYIGYYDETYFCFYCTKGCLW